MCTVCGCASASPVIRGPKKSGCAPGHFHEMKRRGFRYHAKHEHGPAPRQEYAHGPLGAAHAPGFGAERILQIEQDLLAKNDGHAATNRTLLSEKGIFALNLVSSPGSGKTTLLVETIKRWQERGSVAVIEGDQQTSNDAERIRAAGAPAVQINTGKGCHLDAHMVGQALQKLEGERALHEDSLLLIENVGNLVCPAAFDLGEAHKVVILSVTEGEDKPLKYPDMFRAADLLLLSKTDLLPHLDFDAEAAVNNARKVRPDIEIIQVSTKTNEGFDAWMSWLNAGCQRARAQKT